MVFHQTFLNINRGVLRGTVLGPILFSIMVNDIKPVSSSSLLIKYANQLVYLSSQAQVRLTHHIKKLWADDNKMTLNFNKPDL